MIRRLLAALLLSFWALVGDAATTTFAVGTADTGASPNTSGAFSPATNDLLVVFVQASGTLDATATLSSSIGGFTFTQIAVKADPNPTDRIFAYVADALVSDTSSQTVTWTESSDPANGTVIFVYRIAGMSRVGLDAILQSASANGAPATTPAATFASSALTGNVTLVGVGNDSNPAGLTPPTNWTEPASGDLGYDTPTSGAETAFRDSGFTGTTITWGGSSATQHQEIILELDTSAAEATPTFDTTPSVTAETTDTYTVSYDTANATNFFLAAVAKDSAACTCDSIEANTCAGEIAYATEAATNAADTLNITIPGGDPFPLYDLKACAENVTLDTAVTSLDDETLDVPSGRQYVTKSGAPGGGEVGLLDGASPAAVDGDRMDVSLLSDSFLQGVDAHCITVNANTTFVIDTTKDSDCSTDVAPDSSRQHLTRRFYDVSLAAWSDAPAVSFYNGNQAPVYIGMTPEPGELPYLFEKGVNFSLAVTDLFSDFEGDTLTLSFTNQPAGGATDGTDWTGPFTTCGRFATVAPKATDIAGDFDEETITVEVGETIPNVADLSEAAAITAIETTADCDLDAVAGTSAHHPTIAEGNVVSTSPAIGELVPFDQVVTYSLSLGPSPMDAYGRFRLRLRLGL